MHPAPPGSARRQKLLVKVFGCDREYYKRVRFDQSIGAYGSADEPDSVTQARSTWPPTCMSSVPSNPKASARPVAAAQARGLCYPPLAGTCAMKGGSMKITLGIAAAGLTFLAGLAFRCWDHFAGVSGTRYVLKGHGWTGGPNVLQLTAFLWLLAGAVTCLLLSLRDRLVLQFSTATVSSTNVGMMICMVSDIAACMVTTRCGMVTSSGWWWTSRPSHPPSRSMSCVPSLVPGRVPVWSC
jgi:hypothetical protein